MNEAKMSPVEYKVLVKPDTPPETVGGGRIVVPETVRDRNRQEEVKATLIAVGGNAFKDWCPPIPQVGDRVYTGKFAGIRTKAPNGEWYQFINDKDIIGIIHEE